MSENSVLSNVAFACDIFANKAMTRKADPRKGNAVGWRSKGVGVEPEKVYWNQAKWAWLTEAESLAEKEELATFEVGQ
ncbi:MAG: hypothetical protein NTV72_00410 [Candidatus Taylorbacteria bacterium]|nr:hypothetical protein [Candidatus Taylorbacteria bacterium]